MRRLAGAFALGLVWAATAAGQAGEESAVAIPGSFFAPRELDVLVGQTVSWRNTDTRSHTVTAAAGSFDSGFLSSGGSFSHRFDRDGEYAYHCRIHRFMRGTVRAHRLILRASAETPLVGGKVRLAGTIPSAGERVLLEEITPAGTHVVQSGDPAPSGDFEFSVVATAPATYRARAGTVTSSLVRIRPAPRVTLRIDRRRPHRLEIAVDPAQAGSTVVVETYSRERFAWHRTRSARLLSGSTLTVAARPRAGAHVRARVLPVGGFSAGTSNVVVAPPR